MKNHWMMSDWQDAHTRPRWPAYYYTGAWYVVCGNRERLCPNYATARAWAYYLCRRLGCWSEKNVRIRKA